MGSSNTLQGASGVVLLCRAGTRSCALPIEHVTLAMRPVPVEPVAEMPPFVRGLAVIRGTPVPVIDAARLFGGESAPSPSARYVVFRLGKRHAALSVDAVLGVEKLALQNLDELPSLLGDVSRDLVAGMQTLDSALLFVLESARLVPETVWTALEARGARA